MEQTAADFKVLNADDPICEGFNELGHGAPLWFSSTREVSPGAFLAGDAIVLNGTVVMRTAEIPLRGLHNVENTMAAAAMANLAGAAHAQIRSAVMTFPGVEHRLEFVRERAGVAWYNDSKATNVDATLKAMAAFEGGLWVILGGKDKDSDYSVLAAPLRVKAHGAMLIGAAADKIEAQLRGAVPLFRSGTMEAAVAEAGARAKSGDTVLLAPACASFDQFENFEHRGREFKRLVAGLRDELAGGGHG
jgi:UDP-N-acetylmuramoylalanine--D-glutamate ligase